MNSQPMAPSTDPKPAGFGPVPLEILIELGQATTSYHEAPPDRIANEREKYEAALKKMQGWTRERQ